ncbi:MAG: sugar phosphorylase [Cyanobacteriota bacterium]
MLEKLEFLYGKDKAETILTKINNIINKYRDVIMKDYYDLSQRDIIIITYGDQIKEDGINPIKTLHKFFKNNTKDVISGIHILPFHPYSSDDGFSVIDYDQIDPELGTWEDIQNISKDFTLMADLVVNHVSQYHNWFKEYLNDNSQYADYFIEKPEDYNYSTVVRPRPWPLLTKFQTNSGKTKFIWTTFSTDQIDLNFKCEVVLIKMIDILLNYVANGAKIIRMDAIGYAWKEDNTKCIHLEQVHKIVQLFRDIFEEIAPQVKIITETNVPHKENISYWGNGYNEAHMVYNFSLPPLALHAFQTSNANYLSQWADSLELDLKSDKTYFFNFMASHDGIGIMPARNILPESEIKTVLDKIKSRKGNISVKSDGDGNKSPYEMNINYMDALSEPGDSDNKKVDRFIASQSILLALKGVPGIYIHSLLGSMNYYDTLDLKDQLTFRSINREKFQLSELLKELNNPETIRYKVFNRYLNLIKIRINEEAFSPDASQKVLFVNEKVFSILRINKIKNKAILSLTNVSDDIIELKFDLAEIELTNNNKAQELITGETIEVFNNVLLYKLKPFNVAWIKFEQ